MKFDRDFCMGFLIGWFIIFELFRAFSTGSIPLIFNVAVDGIVGVGLAIAFGYFIAWRKR